LANGFRLQTIPDEDPGCRKWEKQGMPLEVEK
jgi:hypothetical protein